MCNIQEFIATTTGRYVVYSLASLGAVAVGLSVIKFIGAFFSLFILSGTNVRPIWPPIPHGH